MSFDGGKETIDLVAVIGAATLPSPARRCPLQFNPFLDPERPSPFRAVVYNSQGKFQRVVMEGSSYNFPSELQLQKDISVTTSGESGWDSTSQPSLSSGACNIMGCSSRRSSALLGHATLSYTDDFTERFFVADSNKERAPKETHGALPRRDACHLNVASEDMVAPTICAEIGTSSPSPRCVIGTEHCNAFEANTVADGKQDKEVKRIGAQAQRPTPESAAKPANKGSTPSSKFARKMTPDLKEGLAMIKRLTQNPNGSGTPKNKSHVSPRSDTTRGEVFHNDRTDKERDESQKGLPRKRVSLGVDAGEDAPVKKSSLRNLLRKTSRTLRVNILDGAKPAEVDAGRAHKSRQTHVSAADDESEPVSKNKRPSPSGKTGAKRDVEKAFKAGRGGACSETTAVPSTAATNRIDMMLMQHAVHVEKYLDQLASP